MPLLFPPPTLATLDQAPSWVNRAGRVDRSACLEIRANEVLRLVPPGSMMLVSASPRPGSVRPESRVRLEARAVVSVGAASVMHFHRSRMPHTIAGDHRTGKSNAMAWRTQRLLQTGDSSTRYARWKLRQSLRRMIPLHDSMPADISPVDNASKSASESAPEPVDDASDLLFESEPQLPFATLLVIAVAQDANRAKQKAAAQRAPMVDAPSSLKARQPMINPNRGATCQKVTTLPGDWRQKIKLERWRLHARLAQHFIRCPHCDAKSTKLFMPLCTPAEARDARFAHDWLIRCQSVAPNAPLTAEELRVQSRYAPLLPPQSLACAACLGLRYGEAERGA